MKITRLGISLALLIALALAARFTQSDKTLRASSRPATPATDLRHTPAISITFE